MLGAAVAVLVALPGLVGAVPARDRSMAATELLGRVRASETAAYRGLAEARAGLGLPDVPRAGRVVALLGETTRMRAFVAGPRSWRVDELTPVGERDLYADGARTALWDSGERRVTFTSGEAPVRFARPADLLPPELGRRVAAAAGAGEVTRLGARRVAGVHALGLRLVLWDIDTYDWRSPGAGVIAGRVLGRVRSGDVVLLHDGGGDRSQTVAALEQVLATLSARGFRFAALCRD